MPRQPRVLPWRTLVWLVLFASVIFSAYVLLKMNWSLVETTLTNKMLDCRTKIGKTADRVISAVLNTDRKCEEPKPSDPLPPVL
jgi:hypothetical protein